MAEVDIALDKRCNKCGVTKRLDEFNKRSRSKDGKQRKCRCCQAIDNERYRKDNPGFHRKYRDKQKVYAADYHARNRERISARKTAYYAANPEKQSERGHRYRAKNIEAERLKSRRWQEQNQDRSRLNVAAWRRANHEDYSVQSAKRKARKLAAGGSHTRSEIRQLLEAQDYRCANPYCAADLRVKRRCLDHIQALAAGGSNAISNLQWLCRNCNSRKCSMDVNVWLHRERKRSELFAEKV